MEFDYSKLRGRIVEKFGSQRAFSSAEGSSQQTVSLKMTNKIPFDQPTIERWCHLLDISLADAGDYFFTPKV